MRSLRPAFQLFALSAACLLAPAWAGEPKLPEQIELPEPIVDKTYGNVGMFLAPNETKPAEALPILEKSQPGLYIAVGTERGFMGAAASQADHLLLVDLDSGIVDFNRINIALLAAAKDLPQYKSLRLNGNLQDWTRAAEGLPSEQRALLSNEALHSWWRMRVRSKDFDSFHQAPTAEGSYDRMNYLFDEKLFEKLHGMARDGKIRTLKIDYSSKANSAALGDSIARSGLKLSVLDLSNSWWSSYSGDGTAHLLKALEKSSGPGSLLLITDGREGHWAYYGFKTAEIKAHFENSGPFYEWLRDMTLLPQNSDLQPSAIQDFESFSNLSKPRAPKAEKAKVYVSPSFKDRCLSIVRNLWSAIVP